MATSDAELPELKDARIFEEVTGNLRVEGPAPVLLKKPQIYADTRIRTHYIFAVGKTAAKIGNPLALASLAHGGFFCDSYPCYPP